MLITPMTRPGVVLSHPPNSTAPSIGWLQVAVEHGRGLHERLGQRHRRQFDREAAGLQHAAFHILRAGAQMGVTKIDVAPGVDDGDDRFAGPVLGVEATLPQTRAVAEGAQIADAEPAMAAEVLRTFPGHFKACFQPV
jgi:hypothetical protein